MRYLLTYKWFSEDHTLACVSRHEAIEKIGEMSGLVEYSDISLFREVLDRDVLEAMDALHDCESVRFAGAAAEAPDVGGRAYKWGCDECGQSWITHHREGRRESRRVGDPSHAWPKTASRQGS